MLMNGGGWKALPSAPKIPKSHPNWDQTPTLAGHLGGPRMGPLIGPKSDQNMTFQNQATMAIEAPYRVYSKKVIFFFGHHLKRDLRRVQTCSNNCGSTFAQHWKKEALQLKPFWDRKKGWVLPEYQCGGVFFSCKKSHRKKRWFYDCIPLATGNTLKIVPGFSEPWITTLLWICKKKIGARASGDSIWA